LFAAGAHRQYDVAAVEQRLGLLVEVHAAPHDDVAERAAGAEPLLEAVVQAAGPAARVGVPVADDDLVGAYVARSTFMPRRPGYKRMRARSASLSPHRRYRWRTRRLTRWARWRRSPP
jgi:hypothetical protein